MAELKKVDNISEEYYSFDKTSTLGKLIQKCETDNDEESKKLLIAERMLLNSPFVPSGSGDLWAHVLENLNEKIQSWIYDDDVVKHFEQRLETDLPTLTGARIGYFLWTAKKDIRFVQKSVELFILGGLENCEVDWKTSKFCFSFAFELSKSLNFRDLVKNDLIKTLATALSKDMDKKSINYRSMIEIFFSIASEMWEELDTNEKKLCEDLLDLCYSISKEAASTGMFHTVDIWLGLAKEFYAKTKNQTKVDEINKLQLDSIISRAEQNPSPLLKTFFYQSAIVHMSKSNMKDDTLKGKLTRLLDENNKASEPLFTKHETSVQIKKEDIRKAVLEILKDENESDKIVKLMSKFLIPEYSRVEKEVKEISKDSISPIFPMTRQSGTHISGAISGDARVKYDTLSHFALCLQFNTIILRESIEMGKINIDVINSVIDKSKINSDSKEILKRGIERYFSSDCISSIHILVFQIEQLIRGVMVQNGFSNFVFDQKSNSMMQKVLDTLIREPEVEKILGRDFVSAVISCISNIDHRNLRNEAGHGVIPLEKLNQINATIVLFLNLFIISHFLT